MRMHRKLSALLLVLTLSMAGTSGGLANILEPGGIGSYVPPAAASAASTVPAPIAVTRIARTNADSSGPFLLPKAPALAPMGFVVFCSNNPEQCQIGTGASRIQLSDQEFQALEKVNRLVNHRVQPVRDGIGGISSDTWTIASTKGDCEDVALAKRDMLIRGGLPAGALRMAVARTSWGEGHAVLIVGTSKGDYVLDSRFDLIKRWNQTDLTWIKVQSADNPLFWYEV